MDERLIAVDQSVPAGQNVTLEPPFHCVLAEHLHNSTVRCKLTAVSIFRKVLAEPDLLANLIDGLELVGLCLVWPEDTEVVHVPPHHFPKKTSKFGDATGDGCAGLLHFNTSAAEIRHLQWLAYQATIRDGVGAHPTIPFWSQGLQLWNESAVLVEQFLWLVVAHPLLKYLQVCRIGRDIRDRDLMRTPEALEVVVADLPRRSPTFRASQHDHRPPRPHSLTTVSSLFLDLADLQNTMFQCGGHRLMHAGRIAPFYKIRRVTVADEQRFQLFMTNAGQQRRGINLVAIEVQDGQHGPICDRVEELVAVPARGQRPRLCFAITHHHERYQVWSFVDSPVSVRGAVAQFTSLMDASGRFRRGVATDSPGERELFKEPLHPGQVLALVRVDFGIRSLEIRLGKHSWRTVTRPGDENRVQVIFVNQPIKMDPGEGLTGVRAPMA